ncbi:MAG TPA: helix-turn-helix transcriptional regulator [Clostridiales bacterium]|nr:helix-turn-helix transcriptional regulator [Clostridiales bacterium]
MGYRLKLLRESRNLTQAQLAKILNVSTSAVGMYEQGRRTPDRKMLLKYSKFFNVTTDYIIGTVEGPFEIEKLIDYFKNNALLCNGVTCNGVFLNREEAERIFDAMLAAAKTATGNLQAAF